MTRNRELDCEDLFECVHEPETPIVEGGAIVEWRCRCGRRVKGPEVAPEAQARWERIMSAPVDTGAWSTEEIAKLATVSKLKGRRRG